MFFYLTNYTTYATLCYSPKDRCKVEHSVVVVVMLFIGAAILFGGYLIGRSSRKGRLVSPPPGAYNLLGFIPRENVVVVSRKGQKRAYLADTTPALEDINKSWRMRVDLEGSCSYSVVIL